MKVLVVGAGPGGLYLALLLKDANPGHEITVVERNARGDTFGFGVVFSDETLGYLQDNDVPTFREITDKFAKWDAIEVRLRGEVIRSRGHGFSGIARTKLLDILQRRCEQLGVRLRFSTELTREDFAHFSEYDLVVAADGVHSPIRGAHGDVFRPDLDVGASKYIWLGTSHPFERFTFSFRENEHGWFWCHAYRFDAHNSTFIVECSASSWRRAGLDHASEEETLAYCERVFADDLEGHPLRSNSSKWISFVNLKNETWRHQNIALLGDAAHTAHFSIGSGTKLAMEDAIALAYWIGRVSDTGSALAAYEEERKPLVERFQRAARESLTWFEHTERYTNFPPEEFTFSLLTRSRKISYDNLRLRDPEQVERVHASWLSRAAPALAARRPLPPPMFTPFELRGLRLENRVVVSPMCMYSATDGTPNNWHLVHLGSRAVGGAGLVITEMTDISPEARISPGCAGMYSSEHLAKWTDIVAFVHEHSAAKIAMQLGHAGRKGSTRLMWEGADEPLPEGNWPLLSSSALPYSERSQVPKEMDRADMDAVLDDFVRACHMADRAGFDMLELHFAHGYLLASFLSPLTNGRKDAYGGPIENRMRFPLEIFDAVRAGWPSEKPISVRLSACDWAPGGISEEDTVAAAKMLKRHGCDILDVSTGQTVAEQQPVYGRAYQAPFSDRLRNEAHIPTMTVGAITTPDEINSILLAGRADLCALARPHLRDPYWTLHAAAAQEYYDLLWPKQYESVQHRPREKPVTKPLLVRLDDDPHGELKDLEQRLLQLAREHYRSLNGEMVAALTSWVERSARAGASELPPAIDRAPNGRADEQARGARVPAPRDARALGRLRE